MTMFIQYYRTAYHVMIFFTRDTQTWNTRKGQPHIFCPTPWNCIFWPQYHNRNNALLQWWLLLLLLLFLFLSHTNHQATPSAYSNTFWDHTNNQTMRFPIVASVHADPTSVMARKTPSTSKCQSSPLLHCLHHLPLPPVIQRWTA
jgi:hypothetical protein